MRLSYAAMVAVAATASTHDLRAQSEAVSGTSSEEIPFEVVQQGQPAASPAASRPFADLSPIPFEVVVQDPAAQAAALEAARTAAFLDLFRAVAGRNADKVRTLLAAGTDPNGEMPSPPPADLAAHFRGTKLDYVVNVARGATPLMLAASQGDLDIVAELLRAGADPRVKLKRHGTTALWLAGYFGHADVIQCLMGIEPDSEAARTVIEIDLPSQTAKVVRDQVPGEPVPISSGRGGYATPKGEFVITDKYRHWKSSLYHASMPFFMRLSARDFGMHAGYLPGYPASHGCIRLREKDAMNLFQRIPVGTRVVIK